MEIRYVLTREDIWHFMTYTLFRRPLVLVVRILLLFVSLSLFLPVLFVGQMFSPFYLLPLLFILLLPVLVVRRMRRIASRGSGRGGEHRISIFPDGMAEKTEFGDGMRYWKTIKAIDQDTHNLYFIVDTMDTRAMMAVVIPKRAFAAPQDAALFLERARQYWMGERDRQLAEVSALSSEHERGTTPNHEP